jgi:peptidoglycan/xylan/chitin deacetylase (PgdA/CDA1 family)
MIQMESPSHLQPGLRQGAKRALLAGFYLSGSVPYLARRIGEAGVIICLHEVQPDPRRELFSCVSLPFLNWCFQWLRQGPWQFVSMDEAMRMLRQHDSRRFAVVTFDDGYRDTLEHAYPLLKKWGIPFTIYIPSDALTRRLNAWWLGIRTVFQRHERVVCEPMNRIFDCGDIESKVTGVRTMERWINADRRRSATLGDFFKRHDICLESICQRYFLGADEVRAFARDELATIGGHTVSHPDLSTVDVAQAKTEIVDNKGHLEDLLQVPLRHFAYPYGSPPAAAGLALELGYETACTTQASPVRYADREALHLLPRIGIPNVPSRIDFAAQASGLNAALAQLRPSRFFGNA